jgi:hypothetical protein
MLSGESETINRSTKLHGRSLRPFHLPECCFPPAMINPYVSLYFRSWGFALSRRREKNLGNFLSPSDEIIKNFFFKKFDEQGSFYPLHFSE